MRKVATAPFINGDRNTARGSRGCKAKERDTQIQDCTKCNSLMTCTLAQESGWHVKLHKCQEAPGLSKKKKKVVPVSMASKIHSLVLSCLRFALGSLAGKMIVIAKVAIARPTWVPSPLSPDIFILF